MKHSDSCTARSLEKENQRRNFGVNYPSPAVSFSNVILDKCSRNTELYKSNPDGI